VNDTHAESNAVDTPVNALDDNDAQVTEGPPPRSPESGPEDTDAVEGRFRSDTFPLER
jgi:hypothetical protein